jgi:hypothetical protein
MDASLNVLEFKTSGKSAVWCDSVIEIEMVVTQGQGEEPGLWTDVVVDSIRYRVGGWE